MSSVTGYFKKQTNFLLSATQPRQHPNVVFPEISFIGRSNVGKSSLINAVIRACRWFGSNLVFVGLRLYLQNSFV